MATLSLNYPNIQDERGQLHSIADPSLYLTFGIWIYLVPQYKPKNVLMLGYGGGTAAKYIRMFHGDVPITAVDFSDVSEFLIDGVEWINQDAREYVKTAPKFDCVIIDLYDTGDFHPPKWVLEKEFAENVGNIADYIILHAMRDDDVSAYNYTKIRQLSTNSGGEFEPHFHYYMVNEIPSLPVR
jgi:hypothetical protein